MSKAKNADKPSFEKSLAELQALVEAMEQGELSLEESMAAFEQGVKLTRACQAQLDAAEQKVSLLMEQQGELISEPFEPED
ncbi:MAG: exodeoxyribonuclease VII small subunit [Cellvibrionaceae bacterium]|nr:exodeoxyribonuclease VII small subunit [Cellvibrionaceae bacterium]MCV6627365.1 exodeoxyribonuclease VII small subunit [Cellvibrionaceae bacterium]